MTNAQTIAILAADKEALARIYSETVGYDPFQDDPAINVDDVRQMLIEYVEASGASL